METTDTGLFDKIAGTIIVATSLCGICLGLGVVGLGGLMGAAGVAGAGQGGAPAVAIGGIMGIVGFVILAVNALNVASGVGVFQSRRWGFLLACILSGIVTLFSFTGADGFMSVVPNLLIFLYCLLRLMGKIGLPPQ